MRILKILLISFLLNSLIINKSNAQVNTQDSLALVDLYNSTNGTSWTNNSGWLVDPDVNNWFGVTVYTGPGPNFGKVTHINLYGNNLNGTLPSSIGNLDALIYMTFGDNNNITGAVPASIANLVNLSTLYLFNNDLSGPILSYISGMTNLQYLVIANNNFSGTIPTGIGLLTSLKRLDLKTNSFSGVIPSEIGNLVDLTQLELSRNGFSGDLPANLWNLVNVTELELEDNQLTGNIPSAITNMSGLKWLRIYNNNFSGLANLSSIASLTELRVQNNMLTYKDIEPNIGITTFQYSPQDSIGIAQDVEVTLGSSYTLLVSTGGANSRYQWKKDGINYGVLSPDSTHTFNPIELTDAGVYTCDITNTVATGLTLHSRPINVTVVLTPAQRDSLALMALYNSTNGASWNDRWNLSQPVSSWYGVTVATSGPNVGRVTRVNMPGNNLVGTLPNEIGDLTAVTRFELQNNQLSGPIPTTIGTMASLQYLWLYNNQLSGNIPVEITSLTSLLHVWISNNQLDGSIPTEIGLMTQLTNINLRDNQLTGPIPTAITSLTQLTDLNLSGNLLTGPIPPGIVNATNMRYLNLQGNNLYGQIPSTIGQLDLIEYLFLGYNNFTGPIPYGISNMVDCINLGLSNNQFDDTISIDFSNLDNLTTLSIQDNNLEGKLPASVAGMNSIQHIYMQNNQISGLPDLSALSTLNNLIVYDNRLDFGDILPNLGVASAAFNYSPQGNIGQVVDTTVNVGSNFSISVNVGGTNNQYQWFKGATPLSGENSNTFSIPTIQIVDEGSYHCEITNTDVTDLTLLSNPVNVTVYIPPFQRDSLALVALYNSTNGANWNDHANWLTSDSVASWYGISVENKRVTEIVLNSNNVVGPLPAEIGDLDSLINMEFWDNGLSGSLPSTIQNLIYLENLYLPTNNLSGNIPPEIGDLVNLTNLNLLQNNFTGPIPTEIGALTNLTSLLLAFNSLSGMMPSELFNLTNLVSLHLGSNQLSGTIQTDISSLTNLVNLQLWGNQFSGQIPTQIGDLANLEVLALYLNQLSGPLPTQIENLTNLMNLDLGDNQLSGNIPPGIGNLTNLTGLYLWNNQFTGQIPMQLGNLTNLIDLGLSNNQLSGSIPQQIADMSSLEIISINNNNLNGIFPQFDTDIPSLREINIQFNQLSDLPDLSVLTGLADLIIFDNRFTFEDIEPNIGVPSENFDYTPQDSVGETIDTTLTEGDNFVISITVGGSNNQYQWYKDETLISGAVNNDLTINSIDANDQGAYICKVTSPSLVPSLTIISHPVNLNVLSPPEATTNPATGISSTSATLNGVINPKGAETTVDFIWSINSDLSQANYITPDAYIFNGSTETAVYASISTLLIDTVYYFQVRAINNLGTTLGDTLSFRTLPTNSQPTVTTSNATSITMTSALLNGKVNPNGILTTIEFEIEGVSTIAASPGQINGTEDNNVSATATGLTANTMYQYRVNASNSAGTTNGNWIPFTTKDASSQITVYTVTADSVTDESAILKGVVNPNNLNPTTFFQWGRDKTYGNLVSSNQGQLGGNTDVEVETTISSLLENTEYHFRVIAIIGADTTFGEDASFRTLYGPIQLSNPSNEIYDISTDIEFSWMEKPPVSGYILQVATDNAVHNLIIDDTVSTVSHNVTLAYETTYFWRVAAFEAGKAHTWSEIWSFTTIAFPQQIPVETTIDFSTRQNTGEFQATEYRLFGLPGDPDMPLEDIFGNNTANWIAYWDNGQTGNPEDYLVPYETSETFRFTKGRAFWLIYNGHLEINQTVNNSDLVEGSAISIPLHPGWNMICSPLNYDVEWSNIQTYNSTTQPIYTFDGSFSFATSMEQYKGYYFFNDPTRNSNELLFPVVNLGNQTSKEGVSFIWDAFIKVETNDAITSSIQFGISEKSSRGKDSNDFHKPHATGKIPNIYFKRSEWDTKYPDFASDIRANKNELQRWAFQTNSGGRKNLKISLEHIEKISEDLDIYLVDLTRKNFTNLREDNSYSIGGIPVNSSFEILVGEKSSLDLELENILPKEFSVDPSYPNPFNPETTIPVSVPETTEMNISIFDVMGKLVKQIYHGKLEPGKHFFTWDGTNTRGQLITSGIYFYRVKGTGTKVYSGKLVLLK